MGTVVLNTYCIEAGGFRDFLRGAVETFNLSGDTRRLYAFAESAAAADAAATSNDWEVVGEDLSDSLSELSDRRNALVHG